MTVKVVKNPKESQERLITRFNKKVQKSRILLKVRTEKHHKKKDTRVKVRASAVKRDFYRAKRAKEKFYGN